MLCFCASSNFDPTPSVPETKIGSISPVSFGSNNAPKPPRWEITPGMNVFLTTAYITTTNRLPSSMSTPASL